MKRITILFLLLGFLGFAQVTTNPGPVLADQPVTIFFDKAGTPLANYGGTIYVHTGLTVNGTDWSNVIGSWGVDASQPSLTFVSGTTYKLEIPTSLYAFYNVPSTSTITKMWFVFRAAGTAGSPQTTDISINVGAFQVNMGTPAENSTTLLPSGSSFNITATNTGGPANYNLMSNGTSVTTANNVSSFSYNHTGLTGNQNYELVVSQGTTAVITKKFTAVVNPGNVNATLPAGMRDGINYHAGDASKVTLVLNAPLKDYVYVAGSFNNWQPTSPYAMKKDGTKFWLELPYSFTSGDTHTFQYWVVDETPVANSPALVKTADPFSTLVLSPFDDPHITEAEYPGMPQYPDGQQFEVSVIKTGQAPYNWQVTNFTKPAKEDLVIYELLIRDFNSQKTWQSLIDQFAYLKNLNINAIELMPVMEFEGNISWGYNTAYHLAPDKAYGSAESMKAFIDLCHQNGIAVILDVALNHVYGRSPLARMWVNDPDGDGFGITTAENPYCNVNALHSWSVGTDLNHQSALTRYYSERTIEHWMTEYKIDGFRWDLTKGFTQNCGTGGDVCTNNYQADRVAVLKHYADKQWEIDPDFYVIFEHLGEGSGPNSSTAEETEWANYRVNEGKGIMLWGKHTHPYNQNSMGYASESNFDRIDFENRGYSQPRLVGFAESHDEERLMYKNLEHGASSGSYNVKDMATALNRQKAVGAVFFTVPGPKMVWQFGELGYDYSINYCENGSINDGCRTNPKPIPFELGYQNNADRMSLYNTWAKMIKLRKENAVFSTNTFTVASGNLLPRLDIWDTAIPATALRNVIVLANFNTTAQTVNTNFPAGVTDTWYNLMDETTVANSTTSVTLQPGEYRILGNKPPVVLGNEEFAAPKIALYPNPASSQFNLNAAVAAVQVYTVTGQLVKSFGSAEANATFDVSGLGTGIYLVKVTDTANRLSTMKLIKE
ncbi:alpha-amylase family glycosyl hydrolase [uncultured Flavobacterium sp.]|uniref:alpha-amylase family glycosyl hydrolase n=1 Tax=uncultured Flavobacterium sp. TaxID=165435 RepID=UPI0025E69315|nr:alpha-amylase family glycosyl hydrolase [uncultured Flavobacterium sp.]